MRGTAFRIHPIRWPMAFLIGLITPFNSVMGAAQRLRYGRRIEATRDQQPPVFIIGHWRSGTTYLHELMHLDERFVSPTTYQCFAPHHCLLTEGLMNALGCWLIPKQRPMDNMAAGWDRPQEDEFALLTLGAPTPYVRMAFPNDPPPHDEFLDMRGCRPADLARFERAIVHFVKLLTFRPRKARASQIAAAYGPHRSALAAISRREVHPHRASSVRVVSFDDAAVAIARRGAGTADATGRGIGRICFRLPDADVRRFRRAAAAARSGRSIYDVRYEDLVDDPVREIGKMYDGWGLVITARCTTRSPPSSRRRRNISRTSTGLTTALKAKIRERWSAYFDKYGYA